MKKIINYLALFACAIVLNSYNSFAQPVQASTDKYKCPMKCEGEKTYDKPGNCPVCGMSLKMISVPEVYQCPMKCEGEKTYDKPGKCPVCNMALRKITVPEVYRCPMKCEGEKTYDKPGKCPVCNMALRKISVPEVYRCPMKCEGEKTYDKAGKCPVCGMSLKKIAQPAPAPAKKANVKIAGAMMKVMREGELAGTINLDTISNKTHLYGLGPEEYLKGELLIIDGRSYRSTVAAKSMVKMEETFKAKAPFFVYANVENWKEVVLPDSVQTIPQLETFLDQTTKTHSRPFAFRLAASFNKADIHIVNLPAGTPVHSPEDAHKNELSVKLKKQPAELIGFFSTEHKGVFTHHDSFVHIHLITTDRKKMGHLENMEIQKGTAKLYIPAE